MDSLVTPPPFLHRMKRAVSLNMLNMDGPRAAGTQVRGTPRSKIDWQAQRRGKGGDGWV